MEYGYYHILIYFYCLFYRVTTEILTPREITETTPVRETDDESDTLESSFDRDVENIVVSSYRMFQKQDDEERIEESGTE